MHKWTLFWGPKLIGLWYVWKGQTTINYRFFPLSNFCFFFFFSWPGGSSIEPTYTFAIQERKLTSLSSASIKVYSIYYGLRNTLIQVYTTWKVSNSNKTSQMWTDNKLYLTIEINISRFPWLNTYDAYKKITWSYCQNGAITENLGTITNLTL